MFKQQDAGSAAWLAIPFVLVLAAAAAGPVRAAPYTAKVVQEEVILRSGTADSYYKVGTLEKGAEVTVTDTVLDWYAIVPPEGVDSFISQGYVDARGDGSTGVVNHADSPVSAANLEGGAGLSYAVQVQLAAGRAAFTGSSRRPRPACTPRRTR